MKLNLSSLKIKIFKIFKIKRMIDVLLKTLIKYQMQY